MTGDPIDPRYNGLRYWDNAYEDEAGNARPIQCAAAAVAPSLPSYPLPAECTRSDAESANSFRRTDSWVKAAPVARRLYERSLDADLYQLPGWPSSGELFDLALDLVGQRTDPLESRALLNFPTALRFQLSPWRSVARRAAELESKR